MAERHAIRLRLSRCRGGRSFELNALGVGVFRLHALFFAFDEVVHRFGRFFFLGRRFGRQLFAKCAQPDFCEFAAADDDDADEERTKDIQGAEPLNGKDQHITMIACMLCHIVGDAGIFSYILGKTCLAARNEGKRVVSAM